MCRSQARPFCDKLLLILVLQQVVGSEGSSYCMGDKITQPKTDENLDHDT
jgi:hypothetical protein